MTRPFGEVVVMTDHEALAEAIKRKIGGEDLADVCAVERLVAQGVAVNEAFADGSTPLIAAANRPAILKILIKAGARINERGKNPNGETPLTAAVAAGSAESVNLLIEAGADPNIANTLGVSIGGSGLFPLQQLGLLASREAKDAIVRALIRAGANLNAGKFSSPLICVCTAACLPETASALIDAGADVNLLTLNGTALHAAIEANRADLVDLLISRRADPSIKTTERNDHPGLTAIELARKLKRKKIVELLSQC
jgi:ankyrin repeat protein